jgi:hypothetical protein
VARGPYETRTAKKGTVAQKLLLSCVVPISL